jgi:homoserine acetyltransferase
VNPWPTFSWRRPGHEYRDIVVIAHKPVGETLAIKRLHAIIGVSTSGMNAMPWMIDGAAAIGKLKRVAESRFDRRPVRR